MITFAISSRLIDQNATYFAKPQVDVTTRFYNRRSKSTYMVPKEKDINVSVVCKLHKVKHRNSNSDSPQYLLTQIQF